MVRHPSAHLFIPKAIHRAELILCAEIPLQGPEVSEGSFKHFFSFSLIVLFGRKPFFYMFRNLKYNAIQVKLDLFVGKANYLQAIKLEIKSPSLII